MRDQITIIVAVFRSSCNTPAADANDTPPDFPRRKLIGRRIFE
jgi:hypothetical protein